jgi:hypothetical protein
MLLGRIYFDLVPSDFIFFSIPSSECWDSTLNCGIVTCYLRFDIYDKSNARYLTYIIVYLQSKCCFYFDQQSEQVIKIKRLKITYIVDKIGCEE